MKYTYMVVPDGPDNLYAKTECSTLSQALDVSLQLRDELRAGIHIYAHRVEMVA